MCAPEKEVGLVGNRGGGKTFTMILDMISGIGRKGYGANYNVVLLRSSLREMTDLVIMIDSIVNPIVEQGCLLIINSITSTLGEQAK